MSKDTSKTDMESNYLTTSEEGSRGTTISTRLDPQIILKLMEYEDSPTITEPCLNEKLPWSWDEIRVVLDEMHDKELVDSLKIGQGTYLWWPLVAPRLSEQCRSRIESSRLVLSKSGGVPFPSDSSEMRDIIRVPESLAESLHNQPSWFVNQLGEKLVEAQSDPPKSLRKTRNVDWYILKLDDYRAIFDFNSETKDLQLLDLGNQWSVYR